MLDRAVTLLICHPEADAAELLAARLRDSKILSGISIMAVQNAFRSQNQPDIALIHLEFSLAAGDGALALLHENLGRPKLVALLEPWETLSVPHLHQLGFCAFVDSGGEREAFEIAFEVAQQGGIYLSKALAETLFAPTDDSRKKSLAAIGLTAREKQILRLIAVNMSNKDIARKLDLSVRTVETHRLNIRKKTNAGNWRELSAVAERLGLLADYDYRAGLAERVPAPGFHED